MKFTVPFLALFSSAVAQELALPACGETCFSTGVESSGCSGAEDLECLCDTAPFNIDFITRVAQGCGEEDITTALDTYETTCSEIGVPINVIGEEPPQETP